MTQALLTVDLGFGDAGKGSIVDFLSRAYEAHTVVRYNGGAQAGHRVVTPEAQPREHVFAQFGSGTLAGAATHLSRFMLLDPLAMIERQLRQSEERPYEQPVNSEERQRAQRVLAALEDWLVAIVADRNHQASA